MKPNHPLLNNSTLFISSFLLLAISVGLVISQHVVNPFDASITKSINHLHSNNIDSAINFISDLATPVLIICILLSHFISKKKNDVVLKGYSIFLTISFAISASLSFIIKNLVDRIRPFKVNPEIVKLGSGGSFSFPSGHSADAILLGLVTLLFFENKKIKKAAIIWMTFIPFTRIYLGVHYVSDVVGSILISLITINLTHKKSDKRL